MKKNMGDSAKGGKMKTSAALNKLWDIQIKKLNLPLISNIINKGSDSTKIQKKYNKHEARMRL
jgi:hypothetical protein